MRKIVVVKRMHIRFILFSILFHNLNQFHIIYKIPLQALASWECDFIFPSDRVLGRAAALFVFTHHCASSPLLLPALFSPYNQIMEHFFAFHLESKVQGNSWDSCGKEKNFMACSLDYLCLLRPLGKITSYTHFLDFTLANLSPTWELLCVLLTPTISQVRKLPS